MRGIGFTVESRACTACCSEPADSGYNNELYTVPLAMKNIAGGLVLELCADFCAHGRN